MYKKDPARLAAAREKDRERKKRSRQQRQKHLQEHPQLLKAEREKEKIRKRAYRLKKRPTDEQAHQTRKAEAAKQRERRRQDRMRKQEQVIKSQLYKAKREKKSLATQAWRMRLKLRPKSTPADEDDGDNPFSSPSSESRAMKRARQALPETPRRKAKVLERLVKSPTQSKILGKKGVIMTKESRRNLKMGQEITDSLKEQLHSIKFTGGASPSKRNAYGILRSVVRKKRGLRISTALRAKLNLRKMKQDQQARQWWRPKLRKKRKDGISEMLKKKVREFYLSPTISREVPDKRAAIKIKEGSKVILVQRQNMTMTIDEAFAVFTKTYPEDKIGLTSFTKLRPLQVKKVSETCRRTCLCQTCCNPGLKRGSLKKFITEECPANRAIYLHSKQDVINTTPCKYDTEYPKPACMERSCKECGVQKLEEHYKDVMDGKEDQVITWNKWEYVTFETTEGKPAKRVISCVTKSTTIQDFMSEYKKDLEGLASHIFRANWQHEQMKMSIDSLGSKEAVLCMDYAESYTCRFQQEVQSAFFDQNQVTLHPMMAYYKKDVEEETLLVKHGIIGITDDQVKDASGVLCFEDEAIKIVEKEIGVRLVTVHEFTDGCAAQYKGKKAFYDLSVRKQPGIVRNFYETSHGKSVCDGLGAIVKGSCYQAVVSRKEIICNAHDMFGYCEKRLSVPFKIVKGSTGTHVSKREFIFISKDEVDRNRPNIKTLPGTRRLHSVKTTGKNLQLETRNISCYCASCKETSTHCDNKQYVEQWAPAKIQLETSRRRSVQATTDDVQTPAQQEETTATEDHQSIQKGDFVAVKLMTRRKANIFMAEVLEYEEGEEEVHLSFMKKTGDVYMYIWPEKKDTSWEALDDIICPVGYPVLTNFREQFRFSNEDIEKVKNMVKNNTQTYQFK